MRLDRRAAESKTAVKQKKGRTAAQSQSRANRANSANRAKQAHQLSLWLQRSGRDAPSWLVTEHPVCLTRVWQSSHTLTPFSVQFCKKRYDVTKGAGASPWWVTSPTASSCLRPPPLAIGVDGPTKHRFWQEAANIGLMSLFYGAL